MTCIHCRRPLHVGPCYQGSIREETRRCRTCGDLGNEHISLGGYITPRHCLCMKFVPIDENWLQRQTRLAHEAMESLPEWLRESMRRTVQDRVDAMRGAVDVSSDDIPKHSASTTACESRPSWDMIWMDFAHSIARRSIDERRKVGAVIVSADNARVLALGYNGDYRGGPNRTLSSEPGASGCIHAEINALIKLDTTTLHQKVMYVTTEPCYMCASAIINAGIDEVVYADEYREHDGIKILRERGVRVRRLAYIATGFDTACWRQLDKED